MAEADKLKRISGRFQSVFRKKKPDNRGKWDPSTEQDVPTTNTGSEVANSTNDVAVAETTQAVGTEAENEVNMPTNEGVIQQSSKGSDDGPAPSASVNDNSQLEGGHDEDISRWNIGVGSTSTAKDLSIMEILSTGSDAERLWDAAYNLLQRRYGAMLDTYDKIIDQYLLQKDSENESENQLSTIEEDFSLSRSLTRRRQMDRVVQIWLTEHDNNKTSHETTLNEADHSLRDILRPSIERSGYTPIPWAAACLAIKVCPWLTWKRV